MCCMHTSAASGTLCGRSNAWQVMVCLCSMSYLYPSSLAGVCCRRGLRQFFWMVTLSPSAEHLLVPSTLSQVFQSRNVCCVARGTL